MPANRPIEILTSSGFVHVDNGSSPAYVGNGTGSTPAEQFTAYSPSNATASSILPGETAILRSNLTGLYCRLAPLPSNSTQLGMVCDQPTAATATPLTYTGSGLSTTNGVPLVAAGPGAPLLLANTSTSPVTPSSTNITFPVAPQGEEAGSGIQRTAW